MDSWLPLWSKTNSCSQQTPFWLPADNQWSATGLHLESHTISSVHQRPRLKTRLQTKSMCRWYSYIPISEHFSRQNTISAKQCIRLNWADESLMKFNASKCFVIAFNETKTSPPASYSLGHEQLTTVSSTKYLGVTIQSDMKFTEHIEAKTTKAKQVLGMIKRTLHKAPEKAKLLAYTSLCRPILEYASSVWDPHQRKYIEKNESIQNNAIRFISDLQGRESITEARELLLHLQTLEQRRQLSRSSLLTRILSNDKGNDSLTASYEELHRTDHPIVNTRATSQQDRPTIYAAKSIYYHSFLSRTIWNKRPLLLSINKKNSNTYACRIPANT